jgi:predicted phage baseplate assembly protein
MALPLPNLDDRHFQDLVDEAKRRIPHYCPEWTDHNVSDPGVTLIELFAGMMDSLIYRLNRVPEKNYLAFMNLIGMRLDPPVAAKVDLTFRLSAPLVSPGSSPVTIPAGTEVETEPQRRSRTGGQRSDGLIDADAIYQTVVFSTDADFVVRPPAATPFCLSEHHGQALGDHTRSVIDGRTPFAAFSAQPYPGDCFYIGDPTDLSSHIVQIDLTFAPVEGLGINPDNPPLTWEAACGEGGEWVPVEAVEADTTRGLNQDGAVRLRLPASMRPRRVGAQTGYWLRCVFVQPTAARPGYTASPQIRTVRVISWGGTVAATHATAVRGEILGTSSGEPGQSFQLEQFPVLERRSGEQIEILAPGGQEWEPWSEVEDFGASKPSSTHYTLDATRGEVQFGPLIREPAGGERMYGARPPIGSTIRMRSYRVGGGIIGNVGKETITQLRTAVPYVDSVMNYRAATGGLDAERIERAMLRAPDAIWSRERAVTAEDYEVLARRASRRVARAHCIQPGALPPPGAGQAPAVPMVRVLIIPQVDQPDRGDRPIAITELSPDRELLQQVRADLDARRLLTTPLNVTGPVYVEVAVRASVRVARDQDPRAVQAALQARLYRFLNPVVGGPRGEGWPFGRALTAAAIYALLQSTPGVEELEEVLIGRARQQAGSTSIALEPDQVLCSGEHQIQIVR